MSKFNSNNLFGHSKGNRYSITLKQDISPVCLDDLLLFIFQYLDCWEFEFDDFYDRMGCEGNYRSLFSACQRLFELVNAIMAKLPVRKNIHVKVMLSIMDEIPGNFPEISEKNARFLAKDLFSLEKKKLIRLISTIYALKRNMLEDKWKRLNY